MLFQKSVSISLNPAYKKIPVDKADMDRFLKALNLFLDNFNGNESEEHQKTDLRTFLNDAFYKDEFAINTKGSVDFVIFNGKNDQTSMGTLIETKKPESPDMVTGKTLDKKSMHQLLLYYLQERVNHENNDLKHLIVTDFYKWYIFDASLFHELVYKNTQLIKDYTEWKFGQKDSTKRDSFYKDIASPFIKKMEGELQFTCFDLRDYVKADEQKQVSLFKIFSPIHLLKQPFANDSNTLNRKFYNELLHLIGLTEEGKSKKMINRKKEENRQEGSLLENTIHILDRDVALNRIGNLLTYGSTKEEQLFNIGLELCITWINRILFLKLLEAQLVKYHAGDVEYKFLNATKITDWDELNKLFFDVLAIQPDKRRASVQKDYSKIPYLNSSLFERTELEEQTILISNLENDDLPYYPGTVVKKEKEIFDCLSYLLNFLDAYDFSSKGKQQVIKERKILINASVLGLIFEKINGYKDGSFFTPGFITMYMCRETLRRAVVQKFNDVKGWKCKTLDDVYEKSEDRAEANEIINSLHIIDPAVGSGHFLVSALNELIVIKSELRILQDREGKRLKEYSIKVENDELHIMDDDGDLFEYKLGNAESQRMQEALFHEKQTLIENCLFGVDINPNSVKICRLRLWVELLKHAYYKPTPNPSREGNSSLRGGMTKQSHFSTSLRGKPDQSNLTPIDGDRFVPRDDIQLETLPNIDINIKCGNSLISRFGLDEDLSEVFKKQRFSIHTYRDAVTAYKETNDKTSKRELQDFIKKIKEQFRNTVLNRDPLVKKISKVRGDLVLLENNIDLFGDEQLDKKKKAIEVARVKKRLAQLEQEHNDRLNSKIFQNAFEWRFEFPEVLDDNGDFVGFDVCIGNPPYVDIKALPSDSVNYYFTKYLTSSNRINLYSIFIERAHSVLRESGLFSYIVPNSILMNSSYTLIRKKILHELMEVIKLPDDVFDDAIVETNILAFQKGKNLDKIHAIKYSHHEKIDAIDSERKYIIQKDFWELFDGKFNIYLNEQIIKPILKVRSDSKLLSEVAEFSLGITPYDKQKGHSPELIKSRKYHSSKKIKQSHKPLIKGENIVRYWIDPRPSEWIDYGPWLGASREEKFFTKKRVIVRQIVSGNPPRIYAGYTEKTLYFTQIGFSIIPKRNTLKSLELVGLLNSTLINFYHKYMFLDLEKVLFQKILIENCKKIPIRLSKELFQIGAIVTKILALKKKNPSVDTTDLEAEIDQLVYNLYGLNEEEIKIVEGA